MIIWWKTKFILWTTHCAVCLYWMISHWINHRARRLKSLNTGQVLRCFLAARVSCIAPWASLVSVYDWHVWLAAKQPTKHMAAWQHSDSWLSLKDNPHSRHDRLDHQVMQHTWEEIEQTNARRTDILDEIKKLKHIKIGTLSLLRSVFLIQTSFYHYRVKISVAVKKVKEQSSVFLYYRSFKWFKWSHYSESQADEGWEWLKGTESNRCFQAARSQKYSLNKP